MILLLLIYIPGMGIVYQGGCARKEKQALAEPACWLIALHYALEGFVGGASGSDVVVDNINHFIF